MVKIYGKPSCGYCVMAESLCKQLSVPYQYLSMGKDYTTEEFFETFPGARTFPQIQIEGENIGGYTELEKRLKLNS
jgi:glutaredoxin